MGGEENLFQALCGWCHSIVIQPLSLCPDAKNFIGSLDFTACVILDEFKTDSKGATADRVMKRYAGEKAKAIIQVCSV
jgi:hypothetical protein